MDKAHLTLVSDVLRIELRCDDRMRTATVEIEIVRIIQGVQCMSFPDGATLGRRNCTVEDRERVARLLRDRGWVVTNKEESLDGHSPTAQTALLL